MDARNAESLLSLVERAGPGLRGRDAKALFAELEQQYDDLLGALEWFIGEGRTNEALRGAIALAPFWMARKRLEEGSGWFDRAFAMPGGDEVLRGNAYFQAGLLIFWTGNDELASARHRRALEIGRAFGNPTITAQA